MEYRKLIKFGNSSSVISLPKSWLDRNKVNKGDTVYLEEKGDELSVFSTKKEIVEEDKEIIIDVTEKDDKAIQREVISAYINNYNAMRITGKDLSKKSEIVREILHSLVALEIMEQSNDRIIAKDFLNMKEASIESLVKKIDIIIRTMFTDCKEMKGYASLESVDRDVNRLYFLALRAVKYATNNTLALKHYNMTSQQLMNSWHLLLNLEKLADELKRISRYLTKGCTKNEEGDVKALFTDVERLYLDTMKGYYMADRKIAMDTANRTRPLLLKCNTILEKHKANPSINNAIEKLKNMIDRMHDIIRLGYT